MKSTVSRVLFLLLPVLSLGPTANAGTLDGTVMNRTTGKPEAHVVLDILSPTQGMAELATATSDAQGRFSVTKDSIGMAPVLIRATFHEVSFNTFSPPGRPNVEVEVYDIAKDAKSIAVPQHIVIFQPQDGKLLGAEEYTVSNTSQPPTAFFRGEGNFDFAIPPEATLGQVSTTTSMGMAVNQASIDKGKGHYAIAFAFRPGQTSVRLSYQLPYTNNAASVKLPATYPNAKLLVVVPPGVTATGEGLNAAGQEQGMLVYTHESLAAKAALEVSLSGEPSAAPADQAQGQEGNSRQEQGPEVIAAPSRLDDFKWYLFAGMAALFAMGALMLSRKQVVVADGVPGEEGEAPGKATKSVQAGKAKKSPSANPPQTNSGPKSSAALQVDREVANTIESLKEQVFRLELRRQAGTISDEDYACEKAKVDQLLRDMVQG